jgi:protein tyrosine phosphatase
MIITTTLINIASAAADTFPILPLEFRQKRVLEIQDQIEKRWAKLKKTKESFVPYQKKSEAEIRKEFSQLQQLRQNLWYRNPQGSPHVCQEDYMIDQTLLEKGYYRTINNIAFAYNCTDATYNASTILLNNHHFIALMEPLKEFLPLFFKLLINHEVSILVRLKPEEEYTDKGTINYWKDKLIQGQRDDLISLNISKENWPVAPVQIPYFYTNSWQDDQGMKVEELYDLVQKVRRTYKEAKLAGPIACHCASGVGRTGAFIAAYVLADLLDQSENEQVSIEEIVLKLSLQRPNLMGTAEQYLLLYRFVTYYLQQQN